jgi:hypothetical protein
MVADDLGREGKWKKFTGQQIESPKSGQFWARVG